MCLRLGVFLSFVGILRAFDVRLSAGVDAEPIADVDERWGQDFCAGFQLHGLGDVGRRVAFDRGLAIFDLQHHVIGKRRADRVVVEHDERTFHAFLEELGFIADLLAGELVLLVVVGLHEDVALALLVKKLGGEFRNVGGFDRLTGAIGFVGDRAADQVLQFALVQGVALAWLAEVHFDHLKGNAVDLDLESFAEFVGTVRGHGIFLSRYWLSCMERHRDGAG